MKERRGRLAHAKLKLSCPTDCNFKDCLLRNQKKKNKSCKCSTTKDHCYFCLVHLCKDCSEKRDDLDSGVRKCKNGECKKDLLNKKPAPPTKTKSTNNGAEKIVPTRCKQCTSCKENCERSGKDESTWCKACKSKKKDGNVLKKGCKYRGLCETFLSSSGGKQWLQNNEQGQRGVRRKPDESPPMKPLSKQVKEDDPEDQPRGPGELKGVGN